MVIAILVPRIDNQKRLQARKKDAGVLPQALLLWVCRDGRGRATTWGTRFAGCVTQVDGRCAVRDSLRQRWLADIFRDTNEQQKL
jgi:hypothetical protein